MCTFVYMYIWVYTGEVNAKRIRERYLAAVLHQDIAFFDNVGAGEVTTRIETDTSEIYKFFLVRGAHVIFFQIWYRGVFQRRLLSSPASSARL